MLERKCTICFRPAASNSPRVAQAGNEMEPDAESGKESYCTYHVRSYDGLKSHHRVWVAAYDHISWKEYLSKVVKINETGLWIKQIAEAELEKLSK